MPNIFENINNATNNLFTDASWNQNKTNTTYVQSPTNPYASIPSTSANKSIVSTQPYTSSVLTSNIANKNIAENTNTLNNINQNLNQPYTTNPAYNVMANKVDETLGQTSSVIPETDTQKIEALSRIALELVGRANAQKEAKDYQGMNETLKQYEEARKARETELTNIYSQLPTLREAYKASLTKTAQEKQLEQQIADIQGQITQYGIDTQTGLYGLEGQGRGIPLGLVRGQQEKLYQQRQLGLQGLQGQESNLLTRLGLEQENRELASKAAEFDITSLFEDAELTQKAVDKIDEQTNAFMDRVDNLSDNARQTLSTIIDKFKGMDMADLPEDSQLALADLAENAGIDLQTLILGMKANKDAIDFEQAYKTAQLNLDQYKAEQAAAKEAREATTGGLTPAQINSTVNSIASAFDNEQIVKNYNTAQEGYQTLQTIGTDTKNPADDIAFIYAFAKIMDPNSVVREGEYNTIQKYAQSWAQTFGFNAKRIFSNTNFLSKDAKEKMLQALTPKINTISKQYENVYNEYQRQIQDAYAGKPRSITQYSGGTTGATTDIRSQVINMGYDYDAMIKDGMTDSQIKEQLGL